MLHFPPVREGFVELVKNSSKLLLRSPRATSSVLILIFFILVSVITSKSSIEKPIETAESQTRLGSKIAQIPTLTPTLTPTTTPTKISEKVGIYGEVAGVRFVPSPTPSPQSPPSGATNTQQASIFASAKTASINPSDSSGLLSSINSFRASNGGIAPLSSNGTLCDIAAERLNELIAIGLLDNHAGFNKYFQGQSEFNGMGEVLFQSSLKKPPDYAVNEGWAKSTDGHRENMLNPSWNYGCGATNGYIAVFDFGKK